MVLVITQMNPLPFSSTLKLNNIVCLEFWNLIVLILTRFQESGLSEWVGTQLKELDAIPPVAIVICICVMITTFTEFTSNVATATIFLPILAFLVSTTWREEAQF